MPEDVTGFQPTGNLKKSLIDLAYFDMLPRPSPTFFREERLLLEGNHSRLCRGRHATSRRSVGVLDRPARPGDPVNADRVYWTGQAGQ